MFGRLPIAAKGHFVMRRDDLQSLRRVIHKTPTSTRNAQAAKQGPRAIGATYVQ
jgi:hypothetical protein